MDICFHLLTTVDNAAMNVGVQIPVQVPAFNSHGYTYPKVEFLDHENSMSNF